MFLKKSPEISVCIPVYNSEKTLSECLESLSLQIIPEGFFEKSFFEVIVVNDGSTGLSEDGKSAVKIVKQFARKVPFSVKYFEHSENKGLLEARRSAVYEAKGKYIFCLDSDDTLPAESLSILFQKARENSADITHGKLSVHLYAESENQPEPDVIKQGFQRLEEKANKINDSRLSGKSIFHNFLVEGSHNGFLCGKLIDRELYLEALNHIPPVYCTFGEDFLQYFWITYEAKNYVPVNHSVYDYKLNTGISSNTRITELSRWEKICSTASVFTSIYSELEEKEIKISSEEMQALGESCSSYLANNLQQWERTVAPEIKNEAYEMLCEYWGEDFVQQVRTLLSKE